MATTAPSVRDRGLFLAGEWVETDRWDEVLSPYSGETVGRVAAGGAEHARAAIDAAEEAMRQPIPQHERAAILARISTALAERHEEAAQLISAEAGKPIRAARIEAGRAVQTYLAAADAARSLTGETVPLEAAPSGTGKLGFTIRVPVGVVGAISPFNFPLNLVAHKLAPAFAAGCAVVLKPAPKTPLSALLLAEIAAAAGLPAGWLSVVCGPAAEIGDVLVEDERVKAITFTGSGPVGWALRERAPRKRVFLELGNSTPMIVAADADLEQAAAAVARSAFAYSGQACISLQRIYVQRTVYDAFVEELLPKVRALVTGDPADERTDVGPVIDERSRDRILDWIATSGGLVRFDGYDFETYTTANTPGLTSNRITALQVMADGTLWIGTERAGFGKFTNGRYVRYGPDTNGWTEVYTIHESPDGDIWVGLNAPSRLYRVRAGAVTPFAKVGDLVTGVVDMPDGSVLCCERDNGFERVRQDGTAIPYTIPHMPSPLIISHLVAREFTEDSRDESAPSDTHLQKELFSEE